MPFAQGRFLFARGTRVDAAITTVVADAIFSAFMASRFVDVMDVAGVYVPHRAIVEKMSVVPAATFEAFPEVAKAVVDAAIEANARTPVAFMKNKSLAAPTPPCGSPEVTHFGRQNPGAGHPIIIVSVFVPSPIAGGPDVTITGAEWLLVDGKSRRRK